MSTIGRGAAKLRGRRGSFLLEWLFSNLVAIAMGGEVFVPLAKKVFLRGGGGEKEGCCENQEDDSPNSLEAWQLQTWDRGISQRSREFCGRKTLTQPLPKGKEIGGPALEGDEHHR